MKVDARPQGHRLRAPFYAVLGLTALAAWLRFTGLGRESLWFDEFASVVLARMNLPALWHVISTTEANMALYYLMLHAWVHFGDSEFALRSLSALTGLLAVPVLYALGKRMFGVKAALLGAFLFAANTFHIRYSQEARSYSLLVLLTLLSGLFFVRAVESRSRSDWAWYVAFSALAIYSHFFAFLVLAAQYASILALSPRKTPWRQLLVAAASVGMLCLPLALYLRHDGVAHLDWVPKPTISDVGKLFVIFAGSSRPLALVFALSFAAALLFWFRAARKSESGHEAWHYAFLFSGLVLPVVLSLAVSVWHPVFVDRYMIIALPPFVLLGSAVLARIEQRWVFAGVVVVLAVLLGRSIASFRREQLKEDWRGASSYMIAQGSPHDGMLFFPWAGRPAFDYYARREGNRDQGANIVYPLHSDDASHSDPDDAVYGHMTAVYPRVWLVETHLINDQRKERSEAIQASLFSQYADVAERQFNGVDLFLYSNPRHPQSGF